MQAPGHDEHPDGKNTWAIAYAGDDQQRYKIDEIDGRRRVAAGPRDVRDLGGVLAVGSSDGGFADKINSMPKYVVSKRLREVTGRPRRSSTATWSSEFRELKEEDGGDIVMPGSADLLNSLIPHDVIDEYRLMVFPLILGSGKRLFRETTDITHLQLLETRTFESGVTVLTYQPAQEAPDSEYVRSFAWTPEQLAIVGGGARRRPRARHRPVHRHRRLHREGCRARRPRVAPRPRSARHRVARGGRAVPRPLREVDRRRGPRDVRFAEPGAAVRARPERRAPRAGPRVRSAIHTGEVEVRDDDVGGIGVHIASRALGEAGPGEIVVTRTVRELATGTDLDFTRSGRSGCAGSPASGSCSRRRLGTSTGRPPGSTAE